MNCTRDEFEKKVWSKHPHKHMNMDIDVYSGSTTVCALDTHGECQRTLPDQKRLASHVWINGKVTKDSDGLFSSNVKLPGGHQFPTRTTTNAVTLRIGTSGQVFSIQHGWVDASTAFLGSEEYEKKHKSNLACECGSHKIGSNRHSSWCPIKE